MKPTLDWINQACSTNELRDNLYHAYQRGDKIIGCDGYRLHQTSVAANTDRYIDGLDHGEYPNTQQVWPKDLKAGITLCADSSHLKCLALLSRLITYNNSKNPPITIALSPDNCQIKLSYDSTTMSLKMYIPVDAECAPFAEMFVASSYNVNYFFDAINITPYLPHHKTTYAIKLQQSVKDPCYAPLIISHDIGQALVMPLRR